MRLVFLCDSLRTVSAPQKLTHGGPDGSVLTRVLFILTMAALPSIVCSNGYLPICIWIYADDIALWCAGDPAGLSHSLGPSRVVNTGHKMPHRDKTLRIFTKNNVHTMPSLETGYFVRPTAFSEWASNHSSQDTPLFRFCYRRSLNLAFRGCASVDSWSSSSFYPPENAPPLRGCCFI